MGKLTESERGILWESERASRNRNSLRNASGSLIVQPRPRQGLRPIHGIEAYKWEDASCLNLITSHGGEGVAPSRYLDCTIGDGPVIDDGSVRATAWSCLYLHALIQENKRPAHWISKAREKLQEYADWLLEQQAGSPSSDDIIELIGTTASTQTEYGAFVEATTDGTNFAEAYSEDVAIGGLALLRAFETFGDGKYQIGYRAALTCLRRMQNGGKLSTYWASDDSGGTSRLHSGMWTHKLYFYDPYAQGGGTAHSAVFTMNWRASLGYAASYSSNSTNETTDPNTGWAIDMDDYDGTRVRYRFVARFTAPSAHGKTYKLRVGTSSTYSSNPVVASTTRAASADALEEIDSGIVTKPSGVNLIQISATATSSAFGIGIAYAPVLHLEFYP